MKAQKKVPIRKLPRKAYLKWRRDYYQNNRERYLERMRAGRARRKAESEAANKKSGDLG